MTAKPRAGRQRRVSFKPGDDRYRALQRTCVVMDYSITAMGFLLHELYNSGAKFNAFTAIMIMYACVSARYVSEWLKATWFADILPAAKVKHLESLQKQAVHLCGADGMRTLGHFTKCVLSGEGLWREFSDRTSERRSLLHTLFYIVKIFGVFVPLVTWFQCRTGDLYLAPVMDMIPVYGETAVPRLVLVYVEFLAMSVIKDALSMGVLHRLMHHPKLFKLLHRTHHVPLKECTIVSATFFDIADIMIENAVAPTIMTAFMVALAFPHAFTSAPTSSWGAWTSRSTASRHTPFVSTTRSSTTSSTATSAISSITPSIPTTSPCGRGTSWASPTTRSTSSPTTMPADAPLARTWRTTMPSLPRTSRALKLEAGWSGFGTKVMARLHTIRAVSPRTAGTDMGIIIMLGGLVEQTSLRTSHRYGPNGIGMRRGAQHKVLSTIYNILERASLIRWAGGHV
eukprot:CAMPEP_0185531012 /NCGR_PEP_ID=MMETSP1366-20130426/105549_1 /TAXON_ID=38817 /ORGANISM="Gephyrocapsa oceanica, Strain RCC1303" /LENGTH=455 /DNA_ID=CAMNT_0028142707 /DNA_START=51 /DNA_END=1419 /DNA_ORIENTATION=+